MSIFNLISFFLIFFFFSFFWLMFRATYSLICIDVNYLNLEKAFPESKACVVGGKSSWKFKIKGYRL